MWLIKQENHGPWTRLVCTFIAMELKIFSISFKIYSYNFWGRQNALAYCSVCGDSLRVGQASAFGPFHAFPNQEIFVKSSLLAFSLLINRSEKHRNTVVFHLFDCLCFESVKYPWCYEFSKVKLFSGSPGIKEFDQFEGFWAQSPFSWVFSLID